MSRKDFYHDTVKKALIDAGWTITHDPLHVKFGGVEIMIDLGAEKLIGAEKDGKYIAVEVKSFIGVSILSDFHTAVGQFLNYRLILSQSYPEWVLFLALPEEIYHTFLETKFGQMAIKEHKLKLIAFDETREVITQWIN